MNAALITIGNEVLNGQVVDTNAAWLAQLLLSLGIPVKEKWSVADDLGDIQDALQRTIQKADIIITTGGLGPTKDDLTSEALAIFLKRKRVMHHDTFEKLKAIFKSFGRDPNESHRHQCMLPEGVITLSNTMGTAPGMYFLHEGRHLISLPGVPFEMKAIMEANGKKLLQSIKEGPTRHSHTFNTVGEGETVLEELIKPVTSASPSFLGFAFLPDIYRVRIRVDLDSESPEDKIIFEKVLEQIRTLLQPYLAGENENTLEESIGLMLKAKVWKLGTAESCTGGLIAHFITSNPGSSDYFQGSVIAYSNDVKTNLLHVSDHLLNTKGAVSEEVVLQMSKGGLKTIKADIVVAVSGIAGPGGATPEKPVGLVWLAIADKNGKTFSKRLNLRRDRALNIKAASTMALIEVWRFLKGE